MADGPAIVVWDGANTKAVKAVLRATITLDPEYSSVRSPIQVMDFVKRRGTGMSEALWLNIADVNWGKDVSAAVWNYEESTYLPVKDGQRIVVWPSGKVEVWEKEAA